MINLNADNYKTTYLMDNENDYDDDSEISTNRFTDPNTFSRGIANVVYQLDRNKDIQLPQDDFRDLYEAAKLQGQELGAILSKALSNTPIFIDDEECIIRILRPGELESIKEADC